MRRTKEWWARLTKWERSELYWLERGDKHSYGSAYLPEDCTECGYCSTPSLGSGLCPRCLDRLIALLDKADGTTLSRAV